MRISTTAAVPTTVRADLLAVPVSIPATLGRTAAAIDARLDGEITRLIAQGEVRGTAGAVTLLHTEGRGIAARRVALVGVGKPDGLDGDAARTAAATAARTLQRVRGTRLALAVDGLGLDDEEAARCLTEGVVLGAYRDDRYRTRRKDLPPAIASLAILTGSRPAGAAARRAAGISAAANRARDLQNAPPNMLGPDELADRARAIAREHAAVRAQVVDRRGLERRRMGAFLAVASGSNREPRMIVLRHTPRAPVTRRRCWASSARASRSTRAATRSSRRRPWWG